MELLLLILVKSLVLALGLFYVFFVWQSPMFEWLRNYITLQEQKLKTKGNKKSSWFVSKINYALNCAFCLPGWAMIFHTSLNFSLVNFWCMLCAPVMVLLMWVFYKFLEKFNAIVRIADILEKNTNAKS